MCNTHSMSSALSCLLKYGFWRIISRSIDKAILHVYGARSDYSTGALEHVDVFVSHRWLTRPSPRLRDLWHKICWLVWKHQKSKHDTL